MIEKPPRLFIPAQSKKRVERDPISMMTMDQLREAISPLPGGPEFLAKQQAVIDSATCSPCGKKAARLALCAWYKERMNP